LKDFVADVFFIWAGRIVGNSVKGDEVSKN
jgi:hypothetical protein